MKAGWISLLLILSSAPLLAHPMGNFSINHYSSISLHADGVHLEYIIDMAEIPTFQEVQRADTNADGVVSEKEAELFTSKISKEFRDNLSLFVNNRRIVLTPVTTKMKVVPGAGGLPTFVIHSEIFAKWDSLQETNSIKYNDQNFPERIGWKEIVVKRNSTLSGLSLQSGSFTDRSKHLTVYPGDPASSPPGETNIDFTFSSASFSAEGDANQSETSTLIGPSPLRREDRFTQLIHAKELSHQVILFSLLVAFVLGAFHALSPGHGKAIVAGYLVGSRGTAKHAIFLGAVVTFTHTVGVFALGMITLFGSKYVLPEQLYPWVGFVSGLSITWIGATLLRKSWLRSRKRHGHSAGHHHEHSHLPGDKKSGSLTWRSLLTVGISGGAIPCPSALVVLLSTISLHRIAFGLLLIVAFSLGLAIVLTCAGLMFVYFSRISERFSLGNRLLQQLPIASSLVIAVLGFIIAIRSIIQA